MKNDAPCPGCGRTPAQRNEQFWECTHVECPNRRHASGFDDLEPVSYKMDGSGTYKRHAHLRDDH